jgi:transcriptional regulator with AAA-type ATPase domain
MNYVRTLCALVLSAFVMVGCGSVAHVEKDPAVSLDRYHSFAWVDTRASQNDTVKTHVSDLTERNIMNAVNTELQKQGWTESKGRPDVLLTYDVLVERSVREQNNPVYSQSYTRYYYNPYTRRYMPVYYPSQFLGYDREQQDVREGTMTVRMIDAKTDKTIWQGWTTQDVNNRNLSAKEVQSAVRSIFRKFDVASR